MRRLGRNIAFVAGAILACATPAAAQMDGNSDEAQVAPYTLPDPLIASDGRRVATAQDWRKRRAELIALFEANIYGVAPKPRRQRYIVAEQGSALDGLAVRRQITILLDGRPEGPQMRVLLYLPANARGRVPLFLGPNFHGNQAIQPDPAIHITPGWVTPALGIRKGSATLHARGIDASEWPVETILKAGYGVATYFTGDLYPDGDNKVAESIHPFFGTSPSDPQHWGAIATWAWGLSRALDYLATDAAVDAKRVIVFGHSRYGKAALWAGARDPRFAMVIANNSGEGGAALYRRNFGETIRVMNNYWFAPRFKTFAEREAELPVDAHMLIALAAPRPVYIASATEDWWADPKGEFLAAKGADPVYRLLGVGGLDATVMPPSDQSTQSRIGYHIRTGPHALTPADWTHFIAFADRWLKPR
ncbi:alpha/beta hydrolase family protein [Sphingomonas sp.]|uniref:alpha/beta hydrolase family protein n=1 Tax=Sphingomonas sp. TaxID=28214 RepID=UPI003F718B23